jgi:4-hydroxy-2-oxoheptanedioate aldolase
VIENAVRRLWENDRPVINGWLAIPSSYSAEIMAHAGFDSLTIDMQHGVVGYGDLVPMLQAITTTPVTPLVRVPWNDPAVIMKALDAGALGIICPMINTGEDAERLVAACRYPPAGYRSFGPIRAKVVHGSDYHEHANASIVVMPQIETVQAVENLDEILSVPGIDGVYVGPSDLSMGLGLQPRAGQSDERAVAAREEILAACRRHGVPAGIHQQDSAGTLHQIARGYRFVTIASDNRFLDARATAEVRATRDGLIPGGGGSV